jgi:Domain of unknown function (DUF4157)
MSYGTHSATSAVAPARRTVASSSAKAKGLSAVATSGSSEQEVEQSTNEARVDGVRKKDWSPSAMSFGKRLQRKCACGASAGLRGDCAECQKKTGKLQRSPSDQSSLAASSSSSPTALFQRKLTVGASDDPLEHEADRIADQILAPSSGSAVSSVAPRIQRFTSHRPESPETAAPASVDRALSSSGVPFNPPLRHDMEQRFGYDFSRVRVHSDAVAAQSARDVRADAFTVGNDVVFGAGKFAPGTQDGRRLIAHELTHVVQQTGPALSRAGQFSEKGCASPHDASHHVTPQVSRQGQVSQLQRWSWADVKGKAYEGMIAGIRKARDGMRNGLKAVAAKRLPASLYPTADAIIDIAVTVVELLVTIILAVIGIVVGFGEGIIGMIQGLVTLALGVIKILFDLITGIFDNFDAATQDLNNVLEALKNLPSAIKKLITDWLDRFSKASSERQSLMIGELTGQVLAIIATFALTASRAGSAAKAAASTADAAAATSEAASAAAATGDVAAVGAKAKPVLTLVQGGVGTTGDAAAATGRTASTVAATGDVAAAGAKAKPVLTLVQSSAGTTSDAAAAAGKTASSTAAAGDAATSAARAKPVLTVIRSGAVRSAGTPAASGAASAGDAATMAARARPALTAVEGAGGRTSSAAARAAAGPGAADISGANALAPAPFADPIAPPLRLVPPLPAEAAPAVAPASVPVTALAPGASNLASNAAVGAGVAAGKATNLAPKPGPKKSACDGPTGLSRADAIPMTWYKVREDDYYPKRLSIQGQVYGRDDPSNPRKLPLGEPLGVPNKYWPRLHKTMQLLPSDRGSNADRFRAVLSRYGFDWSGLQADHVQDLDWGGPDAFENLWPLSDSANMSAGGRQNNQQRITYCETPDGPKVVDQTLSEFKLAPGHFGRFFRIANVER